jgi:hypothetical protein
MREKPDRSAMRFYFIGALSLLPLPDNALANKITRLMRQEGRACEAERFLRDYRGGTAIDEAGPGPYGDAGCHTGPNDQEKR